MAMNTLNNNYRNEIENSFAANFWGKGDKGLEVLLNHMRRTKEACDNLNKVLKGRAEIEENYGRQLVELSKNLIDQDEIISMRDSMETLRLEIEATGQSRIDLALDVKDQINSLLNEFSNNQEKIINNYKIVMERHLYLKNSHTQEVLKVNEKYQKKCEAAVAISKKLNTCSEEEVGYYKNLLKQTMIEAKEIDKEYIMVVNRLHQIYRKWQQEWTRKCENFQKFEEERIRFLFDQMWNYANMFSTVCVADDEGCEKLRVQLEKCDSKKDVIYYIRDHKTGSVITEAPKYINYYSNIQYLEDIVELNSDSKFTIPHSVRTDSRGRIPQQSHIQSQLSQSQQQPQQLQSQHPHPIRQTSFPNQFGNGNNNVPMNNQLPMNQNYINGKMYNNQIQQQSQSQQLQEQNHPNGQPRVNNSQKTIETDEEKKNKMKKTSISSIKKKFSKKRTSLYVTNKSPKNSEDESENEEKENKTNENVTNNNDNNDVKNSNNNNSNTSSNTSNSTKSDNNNKVNEDNNTDDVNASVMSVVPQIPAVEEEEKRISNILTQSILEDINSESFMKTPIPNDEQHPSHALPPAPVMLDTSIIIPPSSLIKNELDIDEDKTSLSNNIESLGSDKEEIIQSEKLLVNSEEKINKKDHQIDEVNSNTENTMVSDNDAVESIDENKKVKVEEQPLTEIVNDQPNDVILTAEVKDVEEIEEKRMEEEKIDEQPLVAEIRDAEDMQQKYDDGEEALKNKVQDINDTLKSSDFDLDIKPIPTFKELGFRDSYGNYSTTSTDDVESVNIIEESSIEIPDNASYNRESYNRDSYNSQSYENNLVIIDEDNDVISTNTPITSQINMGNLMDTENADNIPKLDDDDDEINSDDEADEADEEIEKDYPIQKSQRSPYNNNNNNNNNLQPEFDSMEKDVSTMTIDESLVPMRNASNEIYNEIQHQKRNNYKKGGQPLPRMERRESLYGISKESYDHNQQPQNPKRVSSVKSTTSKNNETNVAEAAIAAVNNKMMGGIQLQKPSLNNNYSIQTMTTSAAVTNSSPSYANNYKSTTEQRKEIQSDNEELSADSPTLLYGLHFIPPMLRSQLVQNQEMQLNNKPSQNQNQNQNANHIINVNNQKQMQNNLNKYPSSVSTNNSNSSAKLSKISAINSTGIANNYNNNNRGSPQGSVDSNRTTKFGENSKGSPSSIYSNSRNQYYQYMNGAGSSTNNNGINGSNTGSPHSQQQTVNQQQPQYNTQSIQNQSISQQMKKQLKLQLMPEYQGQPTTPSQEYIEINNIPKSPAVELNSAYNPYDLRIKKPVLFSVKTLYDYEAVSFEEVSFKANFVLPILAVQEDGWWETEVNEMKANGTICRRRGLIPSNFVEVINE